MSSDNTTPDLPAEIADVFALAVARHQDAHTTQGAVRAAEREMDKLNNTILKVRMQADAEVRALSDQVSRIDEQRAEFGKAQIAAEHARDTHMRMVTAECAFRGLPLPVLPEIPKEAAHHSAGLVDFDRETVAAHHHEYGPEQPIEHLARAAVTTTQVLPDDAFDEVPQPTESSPVTDESTSVGTGDTKTAVKA